MFVKKPLTGKLLRMQFNDILCNLDFVKGFSKFFCLPDIDKLVIDWVVDVAVSFHIHHDYLKMNE